MPEPTTAIERRRLRSAKRTLFLQEVHRDGEHAALHVREARAELRKHGLERLARLAHAHDARGADNVGAVVEVVDAARVHDLLAVHLWTPQAPHDRPARTTGVTACRYAHTRSVAEGCAAAHRNSVMARLYCAPP